MTEANTDQRALALVDSADNILKLRNPVVVFVSSVAGPGYQPGIRCFRPIGELARLDIIGREGKPATGQQLPEACVVVAQFLCQFVGGMPGLQDADMSGVHR